MLRRTRRRARAAAHLYARIGPVKADAESLGAISSGSSSSLSSQTRGERREKQIRSLEKENALYRTVYSRCAGGRLGKIRSWRETSPPRRFLLTVRREGDAARRKKWRVARLRCQIESAPSPSPPCARKSPARETPATHTARARRTDPSRLAALVRSLQDTGRKCPDDDDEPLLRPPRRVRGPCGESPSTREIVAVKGARTDAVYVSVTYDGSRDPPPGSW